MKKTMRYLSMAALALVGAMMTGCSSDDFESQPAKNVITVTTTVDLDDNDATRSLSWDGSTMNKTFAVGEKLSLKYEKDGGGTAKVESAALTAGNITNEGKKATFTFTITDPKSNGAVSYVYPAAMADDNGDPDYTKLATQDGTLASIAANLDLATSAGSMTGTDLPHLALANQLAICAFTLKDGKGTADKSDDVDETSNITGMTLNDGTNTYAVTRTAVAGPIYVAIRPTSSANISYTATNGVNFYEKNVTNKTYAANHLYPLGLLMTKSYDGLTTPLTFEAKADGFTVTLTSTLDPLPSLEYSIDGGAWTTYTCNAATPSVDTGHTIAFRAKTTNGAFADEYNTTSFVCSEACYIYGNIMSLLSKDDFATATSVPAYAFLQLFFGNTNISNHPTKALALPATTLATSCYEGMFMMCSGLTTAPNLPATTLATSCYSSMFLMCSGLTTAPNLPATTLAASCYNNMFFNCLALTTAPNLPATTLAENCYDNMFSGCTGLVNAPEISATTLAAHCCATMFNGCTSLVTGPTLSATTLTDYCYNGMFNGCSSLTSVTCLATDISADYCLGGWLVNATATGTLYVDASMTGASWGVPGTWSVAAH